MKEKWIIKRTSVSLLSMILLGVFIGPFVTACDKTGENLSFTTEYQAVFLDNGQVFFGKLEKGGYKITST